MKFLLLLALLCTPLAAEEIAFDQLEQKLFIQPYMHKIPSLVALSIGSSVTPMAADLQKSVKEMAARIGSSKMMVVAPASPSVIFTDGTLSQEEAVKEIHGALGKIGSSQDKNLIRKELGALKGIHRATFVRKDNQLMLVTSDKMLALGESVWRKCEKGVMEDIHHSEEEVLVAIQNAGLQCEEIVRPCFYGEVKWKIYNDQHKEATLGAAYQDNNPYTLFIIKKRT